MITVEMGGEGRPDTLVESSPLERGRDAALHPRHEAPRYTIDGSDELETHLARSCAKIAAGIRGLIPASKLEAVLLGGGYGRGEGGVLRTPEGDKPYNDLEFYVCVRGNRHLNEKLHGQALHVLGEILTKQVGVEVEFKITSLRAIAASPTSMFSHDLIVGHRWLIGDEPLLAGCAQHRDAAQIPLSEATRLLMNRASGLLFARERLARATFTPADADFVARNIAKAQLALGDAVLVNHGQYHGRVQERHRRLQRIAHAEDAAWLRELCGHHAVGVSFKLHPERSTTPREMLQAALAPVCDLALQTWLRIEERRLRTRLGSAEDYAASAVDKWPDARAVRNVFVNLKVLGPRGVFSDRATRHPRERVVHALALLLWEPATLTSPPLRERVQRELRTTASDFGGLVRAYRELWEQVN
jgi:hypothetical protein